MNKEVELNTLGLRMDSGTKTMTLAEQTLREKASKRFQDAGMAIPIVATLTAEPQEHRDAEIESVKLENHDTAEEHRHRLLRTNADLDNRHSNNGRERWRSGSCGASHT